MCNIQVLEARRCASPLSRAIGEGSLPTAARLPDQARGDIHQKAREACTDKFGPEHKAWLREQFGVK
ncbi:MAG: hypothetical protein JNJ95_02390 [Dechloromonas sp.]|nr:hypothetical protein [Dechloromonas sp.]